MSGFPGRGGLVALALAACAAPAPEAPPPAPAEEAAPSPLSPERERLERWKQDGGAGDPRDRFARAAEAEAERRRADALARGEAARPSALEEEMRVQQLAELARWEGGCFGTEPDFSAQADWIRHRTLVREDFRAPPEPDRADHVEVRVACVAKPRLLESEGQYVVELEEVRFFALLSRDRSASSADARTDPESTLRHGQLHFDIAEMFAGELNGQAERVRAATRERRPDPDAAAYAFRVRLAEELAAEQQRLDEIERRYDRETRSGADAARQTEWLARAKRGIAAVRGGP